jgi:AraC family transcriptional regulator
MNSAVERAITCMWERYSEPLSLTDIARSAILSRFHFTRIFKEATGVPPGRFLSAVRIYQAKRLLATTGMKVTDISFAVGFNSLGSFTNHFTDSVGISPSRFRSLSLSGGFLPPARSADCPPPDGLVTCEVSLPGGYVTARVYLGAFDSPIVQRRPVSALIADVTSGPPSPLQLTDIPDGEWFIQAVAVADSADPEPWTTRALLVSGHAAVTVTSGGTARAETRLRPRRPTDLPILLALPDLEPEPDVLTATPPASVPATYHPGWAPSLAGLPQARAGGGSDR